MNDERAISRGPCRWRAALLSSAVVVAVAVVTAWLSSNGHRSRPSPAPSRAAADRATPSGPSPTAASGATVPKGSRAVGPTDAAIQASARRLEGLNDLHNAVSARPDQYAGWNADGDETVWVYPVAGAEPDPGVTAAVAALRAVGVTGRIQIKQVSLRTLEQIMTAIPSDKSLAAFNANLARCGIDMAAGKVQVGVDNPSPALAAKLNATYRGLVQLIKAEAVPALSN